MPKSIIRHEISGTRYWVLCRCTTLHSSAKFPFADGCCHEEEDPPLAASTETGNNSSRDRDKSKDVKDIIIPDLDEDGGKTENRICIV